MTSAATTPALASKPLKRKEKRAAHLYRRMQKAEELASKYYELVDRLGFALASLLGGDGKTTRIAVDGKGIIVIDNYEAAKKHPKLEPGQMPKAWAHGSVRQFSFKETTVFSS